MRNRGSRRSNRDGPCHTQLGCARRFLRPRQELFGELDIREWFAFRNRSDDLRSHDYNQLGVTFVGGFGLEDFPDDWQVAQPLDLAERFGNPIVQQSSDGEALAAF